VTADEGHITKKGTKKNERKVSAAFYTNNLYCLKWKVSRRNREEIVRNFVKLWNYEEIVNFEKLEIMKKIANFKKVKLWRNCEFCEIGNYEENWEFWEIVKLWRNYCEFWESGNYEEIIVNFEKLWNYEEIVNFEKLEIMKKLWILRNWKLWRSRKKWTVRNLRNCDLKFWNDVEDNNKT